MSCNDDPYILSPVKRSIGMLAAEIDKRCILTGRRCGTRTNANPLHRHSSSPCKLTMKKKTHNKIDERDQEKKKNCFVMQNYVNEFARFDLFN